MIFRQKITLSLLLTIVLGSVAFAQVVDIPDPNLRAAICEALNLNADTSITQSRMRNRLRRLDISERGIVDLTGLQYATGLKWLAMHNNPISDLGPISELRALDDLNMWGGAQRRHHATCHAGKTANPRSYSM